MPQKTEPKKCTPTNKNQKSSKAILFYVFELAIAQTEKHSKIKSL
jgi:hypothetical protein